MKKTLKTIALMLMVGIILLTLTGCANVNFDIKLNADGSGEVSYVMGYDKSFLTSMGVTTSSLENDDSFKEMEDEARQEGYTVEKYEDDNTYGFKATKHVENIQNEFNFTNTMGTSTQEGAQNDEIVYEKNLLKTRYYQDAKLDLTSMGSSNEQEAAMMQSILSQMEITYKITLPFKAQEHNATTVSEDGKTLEWKLEAGKVNEIKFDAAQDYTLYAIIGGIALLLIIVIIAVAVSKKGKKDKQEKVKETKENKEEQN